MKIRTKMIWLLALLFAVLIVLEVVIQESVLMPSFAELERDDARTSMRRIDYALQSALDGLELSAADWGNWIDVYRFVQAPGPEFVADNITPVALKQLQVNAVMIFDLNGRLMLSSARELDTGAPLSFQVFTGSALPQDFPWRRNLASGTAAKGLIRTNLGIMMLAAAPILDGSGRGKPRGMVMFGKLLTPREVLGIGAQAQASLSMQAAGTQGGGDRIVESEAVTQVYRSFADVYGHPLMTLSVEVPRKISGRGREAVAYACAYLAAAGIAVLILLVVLTNRVVIAPLARVTRHAVSIGEGTDLTARLDLPGGDEVAVLAREFDRMVERVAESRRQLVDQSFQSGFAELAKGVLHNLGNAMTPLGVRIATLGARLRDAPASDVERAVAELAGERPESERYADLTEFLRLGCRELNAALSDAQADVMVIQRQSLVVQTALTDLMRSTHNEHVIESVRLADLVSQTLEIVPDACRQRLLVESDDSLRRVGIVRVARTVLRLVLQNLIINAADSVRDAGRDRGRLRVAAEIVRDADREQLHLHCDDDGGGIPEDNLQRVFEQGFSTKSRDTNYGIGLHWCATAIAALGGRIWAVSEGPGLGASMHLMLPLTARTTPATS